MQWKLSSHSESISGQAVTVSIWLIKIHNPPLFRSMMGDIGVLFQEPDNFTRVLLYLNPKDLASAELVCSEWRDFIHHNNIWRKKLISNASSIPEWSEGLDKFPDWSKQNSVQLSRLQIKALFHTLHSTTITGFNDANLIATEK